MSIWTGGTRVDAGLAKWLLIYTVDGWMIARAASDLEVPGGSVVIAGSQAVRHASALTANVVRKLLTLFKKPMESLLASGRTPWEGTVVTKAAIVIGVDKPGNLPPLSDAASGANRFAAWLRKEGFHVKKFVDTQRPVVGHALYNAIHELLDPPTLEQLVVYFSGHGFLNKGSEYWMLSDAPENPNAAVLMEESARFARRSGIPHVVFVSDACRSTPATLQASEMEGSVIFPNIFIKQVDVELDRFYATRVGDPALELPLGGSGPLEGIYTSCFLDAFRHPDESMVKSLSVDGSRVKVVPNRCLKAFLKREVSLAAQARSIRLNQDPQSIIESDESFYLGRVRRPKRGDVKRPPPLPAERVASVADIARMEVNLTIGGDPFFEGSPPTVIRAPAQQFAYEDNVSLLRTSDRMARGRLRHIGVSVTGARVESASAFNMRTRIAPDGLIELTPRVEFGVDGRPVDSLVLRFHDGSGTVLAVIDGYTANVVVEEGRVVNVSYLPTPTSRRWPDYQNQEQRLDDLRAKVAAAARSGVFQVNRYSASRLADEIRYLKSIDPTLGLYAAYAYADAGLQDEVVSVQRALQIDLEASLFDIAMLAERISGVRVPVVPFCPMLSQGWGLLRAQGVRLIPPVSRAGAHLTPALWTTFDPIGMSIIEKALHAGDLR